MILLRFSCIFVLHCEPAPSSNGSGRSPLKAQIRVRFPLALHEFFLLPVPHPLIIYMRVSQSKSPSLDGLFESSFWFNRQPKIINPTFDKTLHPGPLNARGRGNDDISILSECEYHTILLPSICGSDIK